MCLLYCNRPEDKPINSGRRQWDKIELGKRIHELSFENVEFELLLTHLSEDVQQAVEEDKS